MKKMNVELKPCPFCGGAAGVSQFANPKNFYSVKCTICRCSTDGFVTSRLKGTYIENIQENVDVWNRCVN